MHSKAFAIPILIAPSLVDAIAFRIRIPNVTRFAKTRHNDAFVEIQIFASMNSINLKLCSVVISMLYCKYFSSYKAR